MMSTYDEATSRCWAEVDLNRLVENYRNALMHLTPPTELICVLKADAYGLGAQMTAQRLWQEGQKTFAVASYNEAAEIRSVLPECEILILGLCGEQQIFHAIQQNIELTVFSKKYAETVIRCAKIARRAARVQVKVETGLNRLGFVPDEVADAVSSMLASESIVLAGMFTHLALRDQASDLNQLGLLKHAHRSLLKRGITVPKVHALDSIGMVRYPQHHMDAVRTGAWLYGVYPKRYEHPEESQLALTVKTRIAQMHSVKKCECLGYDETHPLTRDSVIATLSAGYIDGYPRMNHTGEVEIRGKRAPVVGLVCMDQMMVDVTDIPEACEGDIVTLLGNSIGVDEYAEWGKLNRNESLARTGKRVPRIYMEDGKVVCIKDGVE